MYPRRASPASETAQEYPALRFPDIRLEPLEDLSPRNEPGFLRLVRTRFRAHYPDGSVSEPFVYDAVDRPSIDAVVVAAHYVDADGVRRVFLRSAVRPAVAARDPARSPVAELDPRDGHLWELPAGLIERGEQSRAGVARSARRELHEELGFELPLAAFSELGSSMFPVPGFIAERLFFFEVEVDPAARREPTLDGSALERFGEIVALPAAEIIERCVGGEFPDLKTEFGVRRLVERYGARSRA